MSAVPDASLQGGAGRKAAPSGRIEQTNVSARVADRIREMIFDGRLAGGERIPQDTIASDLGVSRLPVREALISLQVDGLVTNEPRRGAWVVPLTRADIEDHYAMYGYMLGLAARRACELIDENTLVQLDQLIEDMRRSPDVPSTSEAHWTFHSVINHLGGSRRLKAVLRQMAHNLPRSVYDIPHAGSPESARGHLAIVAALRDRDGDRAAAECEAHLRAEGAVVVAELVNRGLLS